MASCPVAHRHRTEPGSTLLAPSLQILTDEIPSQLSLLEIEQAQLPQPFLDPQVFLSRAAFQQVTLNLYWCSGLFPVISPQLDTVAARLWPPSSGEQPPDLLGVAAIRSRTLDEQEGRHSRGYQLLRLHLAGEPSPGHCSDIPMDSSGGSTWDNPLDPCAHQCGTFPQKVTWLSASLPPTHTYRHFAALPQILAQLTGDDCLHKNTRPAAQASKQLRKGDDLSCTLHNEDDPPESSAAEQPSTSAEPAQPPQPAALPEADTSPPPYCSIAVEAAATSDTHNEFYPVPPPYSVATSLPTYDEAEKAKAAAMAAAAAEVAQRHAQFRESRSLFDEIFLSRPEEEEYPPRDDFSDADQLRVGNDGIFMLAFFMAFIFNWIGFCLSFCITNTIAGRYGAICGFGLSLIKWILIVRFSDYFTGYFNGQYWLWWIFLVLGLLLFFRGFVNYLKVRNMSESMAAAHRTRFFFLY
ncbi:PREDICTED: NEDD4 family-interacting protein 2 [Ficedula albicollis]|nr:PREDICTED: NEDD4 family-interacting protein 2 [Ficedula albicollis]